MAARQGSGERLVTAGGNLGRGRRVGSAPGRLGRRLGALLLAGRMPRARPGWVRVPARRGGSRCPAASGADWFPAQSQGCWVRWLVVAGSALECRVWPGRGAVSNPPLGQVGAPHAGGSGA